MHCISPACLAALLSCLSLLASAAESAVVHKTAEAAETSLWISDQWNTAKLTCSLVDDVPAELKGVSAHALRMSVGFSGHGFEHATAEPPAPLVVPGVLQSVDLWFKGDGQDYPLTLVFADAWGRSEVDKQKLEWAVGNGKTTKWTRASFKVPANWLRPVRIAGLITHNWGAQQTAATVSFDFDQIEVDADLAGADPASGLLADFRPNPDAKKKDEPAPRAPLLESALASGQETEVFTGRAPRFQLNVRNWLAGTLSGSLTWTLSELADGVTAKKVLDGTLAVTVESATNLALPMPVPRFGLYRLDTRLSWTGGKTSESSITFAAIAPQPQLDEAAQNASPWGLNVHGGSPIYPASFRRAGVQWFRDYAFNYEWMERAKGNDHKYAGWPWYPPLVAKYENAGAHLLPVLVGSISFVEGRIGPDPAWRGEITDILRAFPQLKTWELANEYDGQWTGPGQREKATGWKNFRAYHKAFAEVVAAVGGGTLTAVENGRAGIYPELVGECVRGGDYAGIQVVNCHHYCGVDAPELNIANQNTGGDQIDSQLFHDRLRALADAAHADGKQRQVWLTEFGWDTRIAKVVTPWQQAVYLQRGFLTAFHAGMDKAFWYWAQDGEQAKNYFDGCGLLDYRRQPKLGFAAFAAITSLMPSPRIAGTLDAGPGTFGFLVRQGEQRIAALWNLEREDGPEIEFASGELSDFLGNHLIGKRARLSLAPIYACGLGADDRFARQGSWDLVSPWLVHATAGDSLTVRVRVRGDRLAAVQGAVSMEVPAGWSAPAAVSAAVAPNAEKTVELTCMVPVTAAAGEHLLAVQIAEGQPLKRMPVRVLVRPSLALTVHRLAGDPGATELAVTVANHSQRDLGGALRVQVPAGWTAPAAALAIAPLKPGEQRALKIPLTWNASWKTDERATVQATLDDGSAVSAGVVPGALAIHRLAAFTPDGDLKEWPAITRVPEWALAASTGESKVELHLAWTSEGLAVGVRVADSTLLVSNPKSFWDADAMEVLLDARDRHGPRPSGKGEHQFWLVPQPAQGGIFAGSWKRGDEIPATRYGIPEVRGASRVNGDGYILEALLPASLVPGFEPKSGASVSALLMLSVHGKVFLREIGWPVTHSTNTGGGPESWPVLMLVE